MADARAKLLFLWHLHQPNYKSPATGWYVLPWVRLHASSGYLDLLSLLVDNGGLTTSVNLTPILLQQLKDYEEGPCGSHMELTLKDAEKLSDEEQEFMLKHFFSAYAETQIRSLPRLWELYLKRGTLRPITDAEMPRRLFRVEDFRDLQMLFNLAWCGFTAQKDPVISELISRDRGYTENDKQVLIEKQLEFVRKVHALLRQGAANSSFELTTSPFYHPIVPLLIDSDSAQPGLPQHDLVHPPFRFPEDAELHTEIGLRYIEDNAGVRPAGLWPPEGSVSAAALEVFARAGVRFAVTDAGVLKRSLDVSHIGTRHLQPWRFETAAGPIILLFRDTDLSDALSFRYKEMTAQDAVADFMARVEDRIANHHGVAPPLITIVLDGENPWPYFPRFAEEFLHRLFAAIAEAPGIEARSISQAVDEFPQAHLETLPTIFPGSWINTNFRIWIGDEEKNRAWELLRDTRQFFSDFLDKHPDYAPATRMEAYYCLLAAEGSDWFWWYGETAHAADEQFFDALFRTHLSSVYRLLGQEVPDILDVPIIRKHQLPGQQIEPTDVIQPHVDGRVTGFYEWEPAGRVLADEGYTAMAKALPSILSAVYFGYTSRVLHLRIDFVRPARDVYPDYVLVVRFSEPKIASVTCGIRMGAALPFFVYRCDDPKCERPGSYVSMEEFTTCAIDDIVEVSVPFASLGLAPGEWSYFKVELVRRGAIIESMPAFSSIALRVPGEDYEMEQWFE